MDETRRKEVGGRIASARREAGLRQAELADHLDVTVRSIQNYESGAVVPYRHLRRIESITRVRPGWILDGNADEDSLFVRVLALQEAMEEHRALLEAHLKAMRSTTTRLRAQREATERRRSAPE